MLLRDLRPVGESAEITEYEDAAENVPGQMARIYVFWRGEPAVKSDYGGQGGEAMTRRWARRRLP